MTWMKLLIGHEENQDYKMAKTSFSYVNVNAGAISLR